jgi:DNA modification methylase
MHLLEKSISTLGLGRSILVDKNNRIIGGNCVTETAASLGLEDCIIVETTGNQLVVVKRTDVDLDSKMGRELALADNAVAHVNLDWDREALQELSNEWDIKPEDWGVADFDESNQGTAGEETEKGALLTDRFIVPPFSILDTRKGYWQERKKIWRHKIGDYGDSRENTLIESLELKFKDIYQKSAKKRKELGITFPEYLEKHVSQEVKDRASKTVLSQGVSILDPVLSELVVHWFGVKNGLAFDCFAGDTVFGYVAAELGQKFTGIELRKEQTELNNQRVTEAGLSAKYINDDGQNVCKHIEPESQDLLFSCPPYFNLEVYSDLDNDASNQADYSEFIKIIKTAFTESIKCLKPNRFAVVVVGDIRGKNGFYHCFNDDVKAIFKESGLFIYNELILVETGASTALRAGKYMESRKVAKMHQNVLVFYKGDPKHIKENFERIEYKEDFEDEGENMES